MRLLFSFLAGLVFGFGLIISGMTNPAKVQNFLDLFGTWDPSLAFVMGGAIAVTFPAFLIVKRLENPLSGGEFSLPTRQDIDARLIGGAAIFGVGWGLGGFCPGPAVTSLSTGLTPVLVFGVAMLVGMVIAKFTSQRPAMVKAAA